MSSLKEKAKGLTFKEKIQQILKNFFFNYEEEEVQTLEKELLATYEEAVTLELSYAMLQVAKCKQTQKELKQKLQRWFEDLGRWIFSQRKDWSHPELPEDLKERFMELLEIQEEAKP